MKRLLINLLALIALLSVGMMNFSAVTFAQDAPPVLVDPFASDPEPAADPVDDAPPALTLPVVEEPEPVIEEEPEPEPVVEEEPEPVAEEEPPVEEFHAAAPAPVSAYSGGTTAKSGPGLAIIGLGSLLGAAALRRKRK